MTATLANIQAAKSQKPRGGRRLVLRGIEWRTYSRLLRDLGEKRVRLTYDRGVLELMTLSLTHERDGRFLGRLVVLLTVLLGLPIMSGGSTTFRRRIQRKGLEPDDCYWITNEPAMRGKKRFVAKSDPPPDLAIEIEITRSALNRMAIYAALRVPEVWRWDGTILTIYLLESNGQYAESGTSGLFKWLKATDIPPYLAMRTRMDENAVASAFEAWARQQIAAQRPARP